MNSSLQKSLRPCLGWCAALLLGLVCGAASAQNLDSVWQARLPAPSKGIITGMTVESVTMDMSGVARTFPVNEILRVQFADEPQELTNGRNAYLAKNYNVAADAIAKVGDIAALSPFVRVDVVFYRLAADVGKAMREGGDRAKAEAAMADFAGKAKTAGNYHFFESCFLLGELALTGGNPEAAVRYLKPVSESTIPEIQLRGKYQLGRALLASKKFPEALAQFNEVGGLSVNTPEAAQIQLLSSIGKATCLGETGKSAEGIAIAQNVIDKNDSQQDPALFGRAYNAVGVCHLKANRSKDALLAFLHTDLLFYQDADAHAEALYHLSQLWREANKADRAQDARNTLNERYLGSSWQKLASQ